MMSDNPRPLDADELLDALSFLGVSHSRFPADIPEELRRYFFALELCGEAGELANVLKKQWRGDTSDSFQDFTAKAKEELTDVVTVALMLSALLKHPVLWAAYSNMLEFEKSEKWQNMLSRAAAVST